MHALVGGVHALLRPPLGVLQLTNCGLRGGPERGWRKKRVETCRLRGETSFGMDMH